MSATKNIKFGRVIDETCHSSASSDGSASSSEIMREAKIEWYR